MKKFKFKLNAIKMLRQINKEKAMKAFAEAIKKRVHAEEEVACKEKQIIGLREQMVKLRQSAFSSSVQLQLFEQEKTLIEDKDELNQKVLRLIDDEEKMRMQYINSLNDEKIIEKLYTKQKYKHDQELMKEEEKVLDDLINSKSERYNMEFV